MRLKSALFCSALALTGALLSFSASADTAALATQSLLLDAMPTNDGGFIAVGERGHIVRSVDGKDWQLITSPTKVLLTTLTGYQQTLLAGGHNATIIHSTDNGQSWSLVFDTSKLTADDAARDAPVLDIACPAPPRCVAVGGYGLYLTSADGGASWERAYIKESESHYYAILPNAKGFLVFGESGAILQNEQEEWTALLPPQGGSLFGALRAPDNSIFTYGLSGRVLYSTDDGENWTDLPTGITSGLFGSTTLANGSLLFVGAGGALLEWRPASSEFYLQRRSNRKALNAVLALKNNRLLLFGENGITPHELGP